LKLFILITLYYSAELLTDCSYRNFTVGLIATEMTGQTPCSLEHYLVIYYNVSEQNFATTTFYRDCKA